VRDPIQDLDATCCAACLGAALVVMRILLRIEASSIVWPWNVDCDVLKVSDLMHG